MGNNTKAQADLSRVSVEEIARVLEELGIGCIAGRGDSPYTQEFYEELHGLKEKKEGDQ